MGSCYRYQVLPSERRYSLHRAASAEDGEGGKREYRYRVAVERIFARRISLSPAAVVNNSAVDSALEGRFGEADILFREVLVEDGHDPAAYNNLGIICELTGNRNEAFMMYMEACRLDPRNAVFRANYITFSGHRE
jgi:hypothetical protein